MSELNHSPATETDSGSGFIVGASAGESSPDVAELTEDEPRQPLGEAFKEALPVILAFASIAAAISSVISLRFNAGLSADHLLAQGLIALFFTGLSFILIRERKYLFAAWLILINLLVSLW